MVRPRKPRKKFLDPKMLDKAARPAHAVAERQDIRIVLIGGYAMQYYGSPRLTGDIDFAAPKPVEGSAGLRADKPLTLGGRRYVALGGVPVDIVVRKDEYERLFAEALEESRKTKEGFFIVTPEHLAAMKLAARRSNDHEDLIFLLQQPGLVDLDRARDIVTRLVGGKFARDEFDAALAEARWRRPETEGS